VKALALVPIFDHAATIEAVIDALAPLELPASSWTTGAARRRCARSERVVAKHPWVRVVRHASNRGRGAALATATAKRTAPASRTRSQLDG
jgi:hypothetical protein